MRHALVVLVLLIAACGQAAAPKPTADATPILHRVRDKMIADLNTELDKAAPTTFKVKDRAGLETYRKEVRQLNEWRFDAIRKAADQAKPKADTWLASNQAAPEAEKERIMRGLIDEEVAAIAKARK